MSVSPTPTTVLIVGADSAVRNAIARLLSLEHGIAVVGSPPAAPHAANAPDVVIDEALLSSLQHLSVAEFIAHVRDFSAGGVAPERHLRPVVAQGDLHSLLSHRELEVVRLLAEGLSNKQISLRLQLSDKTVKNHISHILAKMGLSARTQVAVHALRSGLV
jgi:DNA-binding NarL/FixJ family response regulator